MQNRSCFTRKQTCNGEYTKHCTRSRHQLKMAVPAKVSEKRSNFRIRQFKEKHLFNIAANLTLNTMVSFVILLIACTARIACADGHTDTHETSTVTLAAHARRGLTIYNTHCTFYVGYKRKTHYSAHSSRFLHPQGLHHLEHIHHSLRLASLNGGGYGTEHATAADCVTAGKTPPH